MLLALRLLAFPTQEYFSISLTHLIYIGIIAIVAVVLERIFSHQIHNLGRKAKLPPFVTNNMVLTVRLLILIGAAVLILGLAGVPYDWLVAISAILGGAIGFASQKTIGNFIAGFFLLTARPFRVGDYVKVGTVEGIVNEIAINYTKILTPDNSIVAISNLQLLDRDVTNFRSTSTPLGHNLYCYNFEVGFNHSVPEAKIAKIFEEVFSKYGDWPQKPAFTLDRTTVDGRYYKVYLYTSDPQEIFQKKGLIYREILGRWDAARLGS